MNINSENNLVKSLQKNAMGSASARRALFIHRRPLRASLRRAWGRRLPVRSWGVARRIRGLGALLSARFDAAKRARFVNFYHQKRRSFTLRALFRSTWTQSPCRVFFLTKSAGAYRRLKESLELGALSFSLNFFSPARRWVASTPSAAFSARLPGPVLALHTDSFSEALRIAAWLDHPNAVCIGFGAFGRLFDPKRLCDVLSSLTESGPVLDLALCNASSGLFSVSGRVLVALFSFLFAWQRVRRLAGA